MAKSCDAKVVSFPSEPQQHGPSDVRAAGMRWGDAKASTKSFGSDSDEFTSLDMPGLEIQPLRSHPASERLIGYCQGLQELLKQERSIMLCACLHL